MPILNIHIATFALEVYSWGFYVRLPFIGSMTFSTKFEIITDSWATLKEFGEV